MFKYKRKSSIYFIESFFFPHYIKNTFTSPSNKKEGAHY